MSDKTHILAIDNGTQSVRALLFDLKGNIVSKARAPLEPYVSKQPGWAEQSADYLWSKFCQVCHQLWQKTAISKEAIAGVSVTTQRNCVVNVDQDGRVLRPVIIHLDQRQTPGIKPIGGLWGAVFKLARVTRTVRYLQAEAEANWISRFQPEIWEKTHKLMFLSGYYTYRLTGELKDSVASQVGYFPFDYKRLHWCGPRDWKWKVSPITSNMLVDLVPPGTVLGEITAQAAAECGIPEGIPVIAAATDKACEILGAGALSQNIGCLSFGTAATINTITPKYFETIPVLPAYPAPIPDAYCSEFMLYRGYWMVSWFKRQFASEEVSLAAEKNVEAEKLFDELVHSVPAGSMGLTLQPYWSPGLTMTEAKGAIIGFGELHTKAHIYRSILEGLAYGLREGKEKIEKRSGVPIDQLIAVGGGSQSEAATRLTADVFGLEISRPHVYEASALGAAIDAAVGLKLHSDFKTAVKEMTRIGDTFEPNRENHRVYNDLYHTVYLKLYKRLKPLYDEIQKITNYPAL